MSYDEEFAAEFALAVRAEASAIEDPARRLLDVVTFFKSRGIPAHVAAAAVARSAMAIGQLAQERFLANAIRVPVGEKVPTP